MRFNENYKMISIFGQVSFHNEQVNTTKYRKHFQDQTSVGPYVKLSLCIYTAGDEICFPDLSTCCSGGTLYFQFHT